MVNAHDRTNVARRVWYTRQFQREPKVIMVLLLSLSRGVIVDHAKPDNAHRAL